MAKLTITQYLDLKDAGFSNAEIAEYQAQAGGDPAPAVNENSGAPENPAPAQEQNPAPTQEQNPAPTQEQNPAPAQDTETQRLLKQMLGLLQRQNIQKNEMPTDTAPDAAATMAALWQTKAPADHNKK